VRRIWKPNVTVAAVVERDGHFLLVEEQTEDGIRFKQPASHLDHGESLVGRSPLSARSDSPLRMKCWLLPFEDRFDGGGTVVE
jgi:hypothetical protein